MLTIRRAVLVVMAMLPVVGGAQVATATIASAGATAGLPGISMFEAKHSRSCLAVAGGRQDNGAPLVQFACDQGKTNEWFGLVPLSDGHYAILTTAPGTAFKSFGVTYGNKCLSVDGWSTANGASVLQWDCGPRPNPAQEWQYIGNPGLGAHFYNVWSGLYMSVSGGSTWNNAEIVQWSYNAQDNQGWTQEMVV